MLEERNQIFPAVQVDCITKRYKQYALYLLGAADNTAKQEAGVIAHSTLQRESKKETVSDYNWVWDRFVNTSGLAKKVKGFCFHYEISTDGVSASVLFSKTRVKVP